MQAMPNAACRGLVPESRARCRPLGAPGDESAEAKFENGDYFDRGPTHRRHGQATQINYIGKEANRWEEQFFLGMDEDAAIEYGADPNAAVLF
jgi:hypothetical protein